MDEQPHGGGIVAFIDFLRNMQMAEVPPCETERTLQIAVQQGGGQRLSQSGVHGITQGRCGAQGLRIAGHGAYGAAALAQGRRARHQQCLVFLFHVPNILFHKAAAAFLPVKERGTLYAFLPIQKNMAGAGGEPVKRVGGHQLAAAGIRQPQQHAQGVGQQRVGCGITGQGIIRGINNIKSVKMQQAGFQHAHHLHTGDRVQFKGNTLSVQQFRGEPVQHREGERRVRQTGLAQGGQHIADKPEQAFRVQRKACPDGPAVGQQQFCQALQPCGHVLQCLAVLRRHEGDIQQRVQQGGKLHRALGTAFREEGGHVYQPVPLPHADFRAQRRRVVQPAALPHAGFHGAYGIAQRQFRAVWQGDTQHGQIGMPQALQQRAPRTAAVRLAHMAQLQQIFNKPE